MIINKSGITIRLKVADVRIMGRATQGVRLINLEKTLSLIHILYAFHIVCMRFICFIYYITNVVPLFPLFLDVYKRQSYTFSQ